jgi:large subunit ribosomal protein L25
MKSLSLSAFARSQTRRKGARSVRAAGRIPANIYGKSAAAQNLEVDAKAFDTLVHTAHSEIILVDLQVDGDNRPARLALVQDVQHHPLNGEILHVDFHEVKPDEQVTIRVPVESKGDCAGVKAGGTLEHVLLKLKIRALPKDLPEAIYVDVTALEIGKTIHIGEIPAPAGVEILGDKGIPVLACAAPVAAEPEPTAAAAAPGAEAAKQPEMIKEKKEDPAAAAKPADKKK